ncbi:hypothetical protein WJX77_008997 [Trebouxia sp. C0004]
MVVTADLTAACLHTTHSSLPARWHSVTQPVVFVKEWGLTCRVRRAMKHHHRMEEWITELASCDWMIYDVLLADLV